MSEWTLEQMPDQSKKTAIVTGANSGIGYEMALGLAKKGAQVVMACRSLERARLAHDRIMTQLPDAGLEVMELDLASLASVRKFADAFMAHYDELHILINNAGVMMLPERRETEDGFEMQFGINHLGHFALTGLLMPRITATPGARVVVESSFAHRSGKIDFENLNAEKSYHPRAAYSQSKLANLLFCQELQRRFEAQGIDAISVGAHPGWTATNLQQHAPFFRLLNPFLAQKPPMGALPTLYAATESDVKGGDYYGPQFLELRGYPKKAVTSARVHDEEVARKLWTVSEELTRVAF